MPSQAVTVSSDPRHQGVLDAVHIQNVSSGAGWAVTGEEDSEPHAQIRVLIADADVPARVGLRTMLSREPDIEIVAEVANGWDACALAEQLRPDVVVTEVQLAGLDGIEATKRIVSAMGPSTGVLVLTTFDIVEYALRSFDAGASAVLLKRASQEVIVSAVRATARGMSTKVPAATAPGPQVIDPLTHREVEVLRLVGRASQTARSRTG